MPKSIKNIVIAKFKRERGAFNQTFVFDELDKTIQNYILSKTSLTIEKCLITTFINNEDWFLLSSDRIIINQEKEYKEIKYSSIVRVEPYFDLDRLNRSGPFKIDKIRIVCENYQKIINVEPNSWGIIVSIFMYLKQVKVVSK